MEALSVLLAVLPVLVIFLLLLLRRTAADIAGVIGWVVTVLIAILWFRTAPRVVGLASLAGIVGSGDEERVWRLCAPGVEWMLRQHQPVAAVCRGLRPQSSTDGSRAFRYGMQNH